MGSVIYADLTDTLKPAISLSGWNTTNGVRTDTEVLVVNDANHSSYTACNNAKVKGLSIIGKTVGMIGILGVASSSCILDDIFISGFNYGVILSSSWGGYASRVKIITNYGGFAILDACHGFTLRDSYINSNGVYTINSSGHIFTNADTGDSNVYQTTGVYVANSDTVKIDGLITEYWDRGIRGYNSSPLTISNYHSEGLKNITVDLTSCLFEVLGADAGSNLSATLFKLNTACNGLMMGVKWYKNQYASYLIDADATCRITVNTTNNTYDFDYIDKNKNGSVIIPLYNYAENVFYVDSTNGSDSYVGNSTAYPFKTISRALAVGKAYNPTKPIKIYLMSGQTFNLSNEYVYQDVYFDIYDGTTKATIYINTSSTYLVGIGFGDGAKRAEFHNVTITLVNGMTFNTYQRGVFCNKGVFDYVFDTCIININSNGSLIMPRGGEDGVITMSFRACTLQGSSTTRGTLIANENTTKIMMIALKGAGTTITPGLSTNGAFYGVTTTIASNF